MRVAQTVLFLAGLFLASPISAAMLTRGPYLQSCTSTSIVIRWRTDEAVGTVVEYHSTNDADGIASAGDTPLIDHEVRLTNLKPGTLYSYSIGSATETLASGTNCYFRTSPTNASPVRVWAIGDFGTGSESQAAVRDSYLRYSNSAFTDVWLMLGDNVYGEGNDFDYQTRMFDMYRDMMPHTVFWPAMGNHDAPWGDPYYFINVVTLPQRAEAGGVPSFSELYYSFDYANVHFICLDSWLSDRSSNGPMCNWLRADLAATSQDWVIAYWHHPPYSMGTDFSDSTPILIEMREQVVPLLESYGVDLVLCGHSHVYERSFLLNAHYGYSWSFSATNVLNPTLGRADAGGAYTKPACAFGMNRGTVYVVCGNSGEGGPVSFQRHPVMATNFDQYGSVVIDIDHLRLHAKYLRPNGAIDDYFTIDKSGPLPPPQPSLHLQPNTSALTIAWPQTFPEFALEANTDLRSTNWQAVSTRFRTGRTNRATMLATNSATFFRLRSVD
jgi:hypothetical protein